MRLNFGRLDAWILDPRNHEVLSILSKSASFLLLAKAEFLIISSTLLTLYCNRFEF